MASSHFQLNTGAFIPSLGLGTWQAPPGQIQKAVAYALSVGYKHIDCAYAYGNEGEVGEALQEAFEAGTVKRSDLFITTKLWCTYHTRVEQNLDQSLKSLGLEYVDLYLMHWPVAMNPHGNSENFPTLPDGSRDIVYSRSHVDTYCEMEKLLATGKVKAIGVANYSKKYLEELLPNVQTIPAVNQIENHPSLPQQEIVDFCKAKHIHVTAYSPLGSQGSPLLKDEIVVGVAKRNGWGAGNVLLSYHVARGLSVLAKSVTPSRIEENMKLIPLDIDSIAALDRIRTRGLRRFVYPSFGVDFGFPDRQNIQ